VHMAHANVDVVVLGMGVGGEAVAGSLAAAGLEVVGIEDRLVGGECPYFACIPTKMMVRAGDALAEARRLPQLAGDADVRSDWSPVADRIREEATTDWNDQIAVDRFTGQGGRFVRGRARLTAPDQVGVDGEIFQARRGVVIATGSAPQVPPIPGLDQVAYWTNRDAVRVTEPPSSLVVLGAGAVGMEFAQAFSRFGTQVTLVEAADRVLPVEEPEASAVVEQALLEDGVAVRTGAKVTRAFQQDASVGLELGDGTTVVADRLLVATGRRTELADLGVDVLGIEGSATALPVDDRLRVAPGVWAVGDVTGKGAFTHVATYQAQLVVSDVLRQEPPPADYRALPRVTFTDPEVGAVGLTERQAVDAGVRVRTGVAQVPSSARGWIHKAGNRGVVKLVEDLDRGVLVGATSAGPAGGEVLGALAVAVHGEVPTERLRQMMYAYPTFHRAIEDALAAMT
jgi:pyruvate/2-oxoglutarate dehydrogenase complex dihydrolipoamide dehydrogenase (E3) component